MIKTENLCMEYGPVKAINNLSCEVKKGEIIGLLGPNGAGKSTTLKILTTYIYPTSGNAYIRGKSVKEEALDVRKMIGYLPEQLPLYNDMEVLEYLKFVGNARGLFGKRLQVRLDWVKDRCGLKPVFRKIIRELSKGYKQRTALAQALLHDPEIIMLDEPTSGLDPHQIIEVRELIRNLSKEKTIIFSTHILQEVQAITDRVIILNRGKIVADGNIKELEKKLGYHKYILILGSKIPEREVICDVTDLLKQEGNTVEIAIKNSKDGEAAYLIKGAKQDMRQKLINLAKDKQWDLFEIHKKELTLEEIFLQLTEPEKEE